MMEFTSFTEYVDWLMNNVSKHNYNSLPKCKLVRNNKTYTTNILSNFNAYQDELYVFVRIYTKSYRKYCSVLLSETKICDITFHFDSRTSVKLPSMEALEEQVDATELMEI